MKSLISRKEAFYLLWLYITAVTFHGWFATKDVFIIDVLWDSVFYKHLAFGFADWRSFALHNHFPIPPLYPFLLSFGVIHQDYLLTETIQSWINPVLYFSGLFPVYYLARLTMPMRYGILSALIYIAYPSGVYAQWTLSENLAYPVSLWCFYFAAKSLIHSQFTRYDAAAFGLICAANLLTRIQSVAFVFPLLAWCLWRRWRKKQPIANSVYAALGGFSLWFLALYVLGYFQSKGDWFLYSSTDAALKHSIWNYVLIFLNRFFSHWTALWVEGGFLLPSVPLAGLITSKFDLIACNQQKRELLLGWFLISVCLVGSISFYRVLRVDEEVWSVSLRHLSYVNLWAVPLAIMLIAEMDKPKYSAILFAVIIAANIVLSGAFFLPEAWEGFTRPETYFANAPSMDILDQFEQTGPFLSSLLFIMTAGLLIGFSIRFSVSGIICWIIFLLYIYGCSMDFVNDDRLYAIQHHRYQSVHEFCSQVQAGRWKNYKIYCVEETQHQLLRPNLLYWLNIQCNLLSYDASKPKPPYLLITFREDQQGELVFQSGKLKAYLHR